MKIAVIGSPYSVDKTHDFLSKEYPEIEFIKCAEVKIKDLLKATKQIESKVQGIYLTGIAVYSFLIKNFTFNKPVVYTNRGQLGLLKTFWQLINDGHSIENMKIGIDVISEKDLFEVLHEFNINMENFFFQKYDSDLSEEFYLKNYLEKYDTKEINCIITAFGHIYHHFKEKNIPSYHIQSTIFEIREEFEKLLYLIKYKKMESNFICVQIIKATPIKNNSILNSFLEHKIKFEQDVIKYAKEMEGNIQITDQNEYLIISNKGILYNSENLQTINEILNKKYKAFFSFGIGIGEGPTIRQSEKNARIALKRSIDSRQNNIYLHNGDNIQGPLFSENEITYKVSFDKETTFISREIGISSIYIEKIRSIIKKLNKNTFTSKDLSIFLNITERSTNRLLQKIIQSKYGYELVSKTTDGVGRPRRQIKIDL
ncbi:hypothetical protein [Fusobacterium sp. PH5-44]|uniref:hypothetical protein n=1 Tax=unclassified Fusobacterium TaxID=2648384 RepID=UPI003D1FA6AC